MLSQTIIIVGLLVLRATGASAGLPPQPLFTDTFSQTIATSAGYVHNKEQETKSVFLQDSKWRNCRATNFVCWLAGLCSWPDLSGQTDFTCTEEHGRYAEGETVDAVDALEDQLTAGTCNWRFMAAFDDYFFGPQPVDGLPGTYRLGDVLGTCDLNGHAKQCSSPARDKMKISVQAAWYKTTAYSHSPAPYYRLDDYSCCFLDYVLGDYVLDEDYCLTAPFKRKRAAREDDPQDNNNDQHNAGWWRNNGTGASGPGWAQRRRRPSSQRPAGAAKRRNGDARRRNVDAGATGTIWSGTAYVVSGPAQVSSPKGTGQFAENGFIEYTPWVSSNDWAPLPAGTAPPPGALWVRPGGTRLAFFQRKSEGHDSYAERA